MLARRHRVTAADDYRAAVRRGARAAAGPVMAFAILRADPSTPTRFGFIISKRVGVAVVRNMLRRRLKAIGAELLAELGEGADIVYRLEPDAAELSFAQLRESGRSAARRAVERARREARTAPPAASGRRLTAEAPG